MSERLEGVRSSLLPLLDEVSVLSSGMSKPTCLLRAGDSLFARVRGLRESSEVTEASVASDWSPSGYLEGPKRLRTATNFASCPKAVLISRWQKARAPTRHAFL